MTREYALDDMHHPVDDVSRSAVPAGEPPVKGAQWDEVHRRWEVWDVEAGAWSVVGDPGDGVAPEDENPLPAHLSRVLASEVHHEAPAPAAARRAPEPAVGPKGAQWNEVVGRWERWDAATGAWVEAVIELDAEEPAAAPVVDLTEARAER